MSKQRDFFSALYDLRQNYFHGVATMGPCCTEGCDKSARGGGKCADCCEKEMADIMGSAIASQRIHRFTRLAHGAIGAALGHIEEMEGKD